MSPFKEFITSPRVEGVLFLLLWEFMQISIEKKKKKQRTEDWRLLDLPHWRVKQIQVIGVVQMSAIQISDIMEYLFLMLKIDEDATY